MRSVEQIPIAGIRVLNPRVRGQKQQREIVDNIAAVGLKRPITVARAKEPIDGCDYDLVCGQGRLEACRALGWSDIPALVVDADETECLLMSLVENIARRKHTSIEHIREIARLTSAGYTQDQVAAKVGLARSWISMLLGLLDKGEDRLLKAVEAGSLPIWLAVQISKSDGEGAQQALAEAYQKGLRGKRLGVARRLLEQRAKYGKGRHREHTGRPTTKVTAEYLRRIYQREVEKQTLLAKKAEFVHSKLMFAVQAMRNLLREKEFVALLRAEGLDTLPQPLVERMSAGR